MPRMPLFYKAPPLISPQMLFHQQGGRINCFFRCVCLWVSVYVALSKHMDYVCWSICVLDYVRICFGTHPFVFYISCVTYMCAGVYTVHTMLCFECVVVWWCDSTVIVFFCLSGLSGLSFFYLCLCVSVLLSMLLFVLNPTTPTDKCISFCLEMTQKIKWELDGFLSAGRSWKKKIPDTTNKLESIPFTNWQILDEMFLLFCFI